MTTMREDVLATALALFGQSDVVEVMALVDRYGVEPHEREVNRVKLAILEVSDGKKARLPYFVTVAKLDYRDVLTGQRLGPMSADEEEKWLASAQRLMDLWAASK